MVYGDLQFFDIIIFAAVAVFLIYRLRSVLGKRTGYQKNTQNDTQPSKKPETITRQAPQLKDNEQKLLTIYNQVETFDHKQFFDGAKKAFEIIITAFNQGDTKTLKPLVSKDVLAIFEKAISQKLNDPESQFYSLIVNGVEEASVENGKMKITLNFISEQLKNNDESSIIKKKDVWSFEKEIDSKDPIWILVST